jgi:hypothetical protein
MSWINTLVLLNERGTISAGILDESFLREIEKVDIVYS